jgi:elongation factor Ts
MRSDPEQKTMPSKANISTELVKELREESGVSIMQCKKALEEAGGDKEKAMVILRKVSSGMGAKKKDRSFNAGTIQAYIHSNGTVGAMVELNCETDFVANNEAFKALARDIAMHITATNPKFLRKEDVTEADTKAAREVFEGEVKDKPEAMRGKVLEGKLAAYFAEMVLLDQPFIKDPNVTIQGLLDAAMPKFGEKTAIGRFSRLKILER